MTTNRTAAVSVGIWWWHFHMRSGQVSDDWTQSNMFTGDGQRLKDEGIARVLQHTPEEWKEITYANVVEFLRTHHSYCADDLWWFHLMPYEPVNHNAIGGLTQGLVAAGFIRPVGSMKSCRDKAHRRLIVVYESTLYRRVRLVA